MIFCSNRDIAISRLLCEANKNCIVFSAEVKNYIVLYEYAGNYKFENSLERADHCGF